jgi:hypothetical protein
MGTAASAATGFDSCQVDRANRRARPANARAACSYDNDPGRCDDESGSTFPDDKSIFRTRDRSGKEGFLCFKMNGLSLPVKKNIGEVYSNLFLGKKPSTVMGENSK